MPVTINLESTEQIERDDLKRLILRAHVSLDASTHYKWLDHGTLTRLLRVTEQLYDLWDDLRAFDVDNPY